MRDQSKPDKSENRSKPLSNIGLLQSKNGGGGGNRTRVRRCVHEGFYVRSLSFKRFAPPDRVRRAVQLR